MLALSTVFRCHLSVVALRQLPPVLRMELPVSTSLSYTSFVHTTEHLLLSSCCFAIITEGFYLIGVASLLARLVDFRVLFWALLTHLTPPFFAFKCVFSSISCCSYFIRVCINGVIVVHLNVHVPILLRRRWYKIYIYIFIGESSHQGFLRSNFFDKSRNCLIR